ncbi:MAG: hypothetical protein IPK80_17475 [Nannocystis sp.]|nr:hypothetical protein [Nannocystis sp.]
MSLPQESRERLLLALRAAAPDQWLAQVRAVLRAYEGDLDDAARALGIERARLAEWLDEAPELAQ